jgi:D-alanine-D-alanine ligase
MFLSAVTAAGSILGAQYWGKGDRGAMRQLFHLMLRCTGLLSLLFCAACELVPEALMRVFTHDDELLVETYINGTELTVSVLGNDNPTALPVIEIVPKNDFYDFESKYAPGGSDHICPARLNAQDTAKVQALAVSAHKALGCSGVSRTDIIMDKQGVCWVLETNTVPGMTGTSLLPDAARAAGYTFPQLCTRLIELALEKAE